MSLRCRLFGHDLVPTILERGISSTVRTRFAQCLRCGHSVYFEVSDDE